MAKQFIERNLQIELHPSNLFLSSIFWFNIENTHKKKNPPSPQNRTTNQSYHPLNVHFNTIDTNHKDRD